MKKAILYINQFFGQIGGEEKADFQPVIKEGLVGPALRFQEELNNHIEITNTIICGDNYMGSNTHKAVEIILAFLEDKEIDIFFAGPAFRAGRYGFACGSIGKAVGEKFAVPVITSMDIENPGVEMFRKDMYIFKGGASAAAMKKDIEAMTSFSKKLVKGEKLLSAQEEGYYPRGIRHQAWSEPPVSAADRVIDMLLKKVHGKEFKTELPIEEIEKIPIADPIKDLSKAKIAIITTGGIVPVDNPDRIQSASATRWGKYDTSNVDSLSSEDYKTIHGGFDPIFANEDPNIIVPIDVMKDYEKQGKIGKLHKYFYSTVGTGTTQDEAARMAREIVVDLKKHKVDGVIMIAT